MAGLETAFGAATPWVAMAAGALVVGLLVVAFLQGRAITIWPPSIGPRSRGRGQAVEDEDAALGRGGVDDQDSPAARPERMARLSDRVPRRDRAARRPASRDRQGASDHEYTTDLARDFYQKIAPNYDLRNRNSGNLVTTHLETVDTVQRLRAQRPLLRVLDLGGGTGKLIAIPFFNDPTVSWTYVDFCPAMAAEFRRNLAGQPLGDNAEIVVDDLVRVLRQLPAASYDVVLLSFVLSSMPAALDLTPVARVMRPDGSLVITDINPGYTHEKPLYKVPVGGQVVALRTTPVDPFDVIRRAGAAGLTMAEQRTFGEGVTYYSFMTVFTAARQAALNASRGGDGGAVTTSPA
jgi:ubiquinone/menaquinone biosynthesis C-methylase UbiE